MADPEINDMHDVGEIDMPNKPFQDTAEMVSEIEGAFASFTGGNSSQTEESFYVVLVFEDTDQRDEFIAKAGIPKGDVPYANGYEYAKRLGIALKRTGSVKGRARRDDFDDLALPLPDGQ